MKIDKLLVKNFGKIKQMYCVQMKKVNWIVGQSNTGKTTLLNALLAAFFPGDKRYIRMGVENCYVKIETDKNKFEINQSEKNTSYYFNNKAITRTAYSKLLQFDRDMMLYCLSPVRFDEHPVVFRKKILSKILGLSSADYEITPEDAKKEIEDININEADKIIKLSRERKNKISKINSEINENEIRTEAYRLYINYLREATKDIPSKNLAKEILATENRMEISETEHEMRTEKKNKIISEGVDANFAMRKKLRYQFLQSIMNKENDPDNVKIGNLISDLKIFLEIFKINDLELDVKNYDIVAKGHNKDRISLSSKWVIDLALKKIAAEDSGIKTIVLDDFHILGKNLRKLFIKEFVAGYSTELDSILIQVFKIYLPRNTGEQGFCEL